MRIDLTDVIVSIGAGSIGQAIVRRVSAGKHVLLADVRQDNAYAAAKVLFDAGFNVSTATVEGSARARVEALVEVATKLGQVFGMIHAAGGSPSQSLPETIRWGKRGARGNTISPGIIITPLANDELKGPRGPGYRRMLEVSAAGRVGTLDEVGTVGALLMGPEGAFITGSDFLIDGGVAAAYWFGNLAPK